MISWGAHAMIGLLWLIRRRRIYASAAGLHAGIAQTRRAGPALPDAALRRRVAVCELAPLPTGQSVYRLRPHRPAPGAPRVLYLHGGAYVRPITRFHWQALGDWVQATGAEVTVPLYPLAPEHSGRTALDAVAALCSRERLGNTPWCLMGDSAGGGLALALAAHLRDHGLPLPRRLLLICPWVDLALPHPDVARIAPHDPMLARLGLHEAARLYAGPLPIDDPALSPTHADPTGLPPVSIWLAGRDIATPDALAWVARARACGVPVELHQGAGMVHVWPLLGFREARAARAQVARALSDQA